VELTKDFDVVRLVIRDDGIGFDPLSVQEGHYGMLIMRERAETIGGDLFIDSSPGRGTRITLSTEMDQQGLASSTNP
jgi:signal transduction histidine kinase